MSQFDPDEQRAAARENWERAATGWGNRADRIRDWGMPVSAVMVDALALQPGQRVLELAAGPGDTGFLAAELIQPGGVLISSDGAEAMLEVARRRAAASGLSNVEFQQLELEWIDLPTASVDAVLCRWALMLLVDPEAAAREIRRVLRAGGRAAFAVWDTAERNPWSTIPGRAMVSLGHAEPPDEEGGPGMFSLAAPGRLAELLETAGFTDVVVRATAVERRYARIEDYVEETAELSPMFGPAFLELPSPDQADVLALIKAETDRFRQDNGEIVVPGSSLAAVATA
jgi:SAM-dependent methyltransferase